MTETSPLGTYNTPKADAEPPEARRCCGAREPGPRHLRRRDAHRRRRRRRRCRGTASPSATCMVRGHWVCERYFGAAAGRRWTPEGWFATGDVATHRRRRLHGDHRPLQGRDQVRRRMDQLDPAGEHRRRPSRAWPRPPSSPRSTRNGTSARCCWWCRRPGETIDAGALLASYAGQVPKWWLPDAVLVVDELPHTATGKLNKLALRALYGGRLQQMLVTE